MKDKWKMKHMSLRGQILRLSAAASILVCACVAAFIIGLGYTNQQQLDRSVEQAAEILSGEITSYQEELENIAELVAYNGLMLRLSQTSDLVNITSGANNVNDLLSIVLSCNDSAANVIVTDFGNLVLGVDSGEYSSLYAAKNYLETNPGTNRAHISYQKNGGHQRNIFICCALCRVPQEISIIRSLSIIWSRSRGLLRSSIRAGATGSSTMREIWSRGMN